MLLPAPERREIVVNTAYFSNSKEIYFFTIGNFIFSVIFVPPKGGDIAQLVEHRTENP